MSEPSIKEVDVCQASGSDGGVTSEAEGQLESRGIRIIPGDWLSRGRPLGVPKKRG